MRASLKATGSPTVPDPVTWSASKGTDRAQPTSVIEKPWGSYKILERGERYLVKNILVIPGGKLSLQSHKHRSEHWVVVEGIATITINESKKQLKSNESIFIPQNTKHRLENNGDKDIMIIETQFGNILSEEDIIRYEDIYDRV